MKTSASRKNSVRSNGHEPPELAGLERHEKSGDTAELPHVLIVQASGRAARREISRELREEYRQALEAR